MIGAADEGGSARTIARLSAPRARRRPARRIPWTQGVRRSTWVEWLFVAPALVLIGVVSGHPMDLVFVPLEVAAVGAAVGISALIALDGESNWLEGALLMLVYLILAAAFFEFRLATAL